MPRSIRSRPAYLLGVLLILGIGPCHSTDDGVSTGSTTATKRPVVAAAQPVRENRNRWKPVKNLYHMPRFSSRGQNSRAMFSLPETGRRHRE
jgi:hypothetical protein